MPLKFAVIPTKNSYEEYSLSVVSKINDVKNCRAELDNNYGTQLSVRINQNKSQNRNVIAIGNSEMEHDMILLHFADKSVRPKSMELDDFISLLENYDEEDSESDSESESGSDDGNILDMFVRTEKTGKTEKPVKTKKVEAQPAENLKKDSEENEEFELECVVC